MKTIRVRCGVFPDGSTYFTPCSNSNDSLKEIREVAKAWRGRNQEYIDCGIGFTQLTMSEAAYRALPARGEFSLPASGKREG